MKCLYCQMYAENMNAQSNERKKNVFNIHARTMTLVQSMDMYWTQSFLHFQFSWRQKKKKRCVCIFFDCCIRLTFYIYVYGISNLKFNLTRTFNRNNFKRLFEKLKKCKNCKRSTFHYSFFIFVQSILCNSMVDSGTTKKKKKIRKLKSKPSLCAKLKSLCETNFSSIENSQSILVKVSYIDSVEETIA